MRTIKLLIYYTIYILSWLGWILPKLLSNSLLLTLLSNSLLLGIGLYAVELLIYYTIYILKLARWLNIGIRRTIKGWGCDPNIYSLAF